MHGCGSLDCRMPIPCTDGVNDSVDFCSSFEIVFPCKPCYTHTWSRSSQAEQDGQHKRVQARPRQALPSRKASSKVANGKTRLTGNCKLRE
eukprot:6090717-Amphidinium_carterae.1